MVISGVKIACTFSNKILQEKCNEKILRTSITIHIFHLWIISFPIQIIVDKNSNVSHLCFSVRSMCCRYKAFAIKSQTRNMVKYHILISSYEHFQQSIKYKANYRFTFKNKDMTT